MKKRLLSLFLFTTFLLFSEGFAPETLIKTPDGYTPIEHIKTGLAVESFDRKNNVITSHLITAKHTHTAKSYLVIKLENEDITCSLNQKFYLHALDKWIKAKELLSNETIKNLFCNEFSVLDITKIDEPKKFHTLTINPHHNFYVTRSNILTHNFAPAVIPIITYSVGEGIILFGGLGVAGVTGIVYRQTIKEVLQGVVRSLNGRTHEQIITNYNHSPFNQPNSPEDPEDENKETAHNLEEVITKTKFGKSIKNKLERTNKIVQGERVYRVTNKAKEYGLKKGDQIYLDAKHKNHIEIFNKNNQFKKVINFTGEIIKNKTDQGIGRILK